MKKQSGVKGSRGKSQDRKLVSEQPYEKRYETDKMKVSSAELDKAKKKVGRSRKAIEGELRKKK